MVIDEKIAKIQDVTRRLNSLLQDPEPGLTSWVCAVGQALTELAEFAPVREAEPRMRELRSRIEQVIDAYGRDHDVNYHRVGTYAITVRVRPEEHDRVVSLLTERET